MDIKKITERNREFWNKQWEINFELEERMLREEVEEMISALKRWDLVEFCDWLVDTLWVGVGSAWKWWVSPENVEKCFEEIVDSNYSKFPITRNEEGKIQKWPYFKKPDLAQYLLLRAS